jgi:hypothetical protein
MSLFQPSHSDPKKAANWGVTRCWETPATDVCVLEAAPDNAAGHAMLTRSNGVFVEWSLLPPPVGAQVAMVGVPSTTVSIRDEGWSLNQPHLLQTGAVSAVCDIRHDRGMYTFPGFLVDQEIDHGASGGPVFWNGRLCGLVSGGLGGQTYVASLWPLCLMEIEYPNLGSLNRRDSIANWLRRGLVVSPDWPRIEKLISKRVDDTGVEYAHIEL